MERQQLQENRAYTVHGMLECSDEAKIIGEFTRALLDWHPVSEVIVDWSNETNRVRVQDWFLRRNQLLIAHPDSFWFMTHCEAEGINFLKRTFDNLAREDDTTRQAKQQHFERVIHYIGKHNPKVAEAIWFYREHKRTSVNPTRATK